MKEIADKVSEKNKNNEFSEPFTNSAEQGIISQKEYFDREIVNNENLDGYYIVRNDDFIYNPRISVTAPVGPINRNRLGRNGVMSPLYTVFRTHDIDNLYLEFYFKTTKWHRFMKLNGDSGARFDRFTISSTQFMEMPIPYPTLDEQQKIGKYFDSLDHLITLHQCKYNTDKNRESFAWEQRKVSEIAIEKLSNGIMNNQSDDETEVKHINVINMYDTDKIHPEKLTFSNYDEEAVKKCNVGFGDIFLTRSSLKPEGIAEANVLLDSGRFVYDDHLIRLKVNKEKYDPFFVKLNLSGNAFKRQFIVRAKTTAFTTIGQEDISECLGFFPKKEEQQQIGECFMTLDHLITLHHRKHFYLKIATKTLKITIQLTKGGRKNVRIGVNDREKTD